MSTPYPGSKVVYVSVDADHDVSTDALALSTDGGKTFTVGATYVASPSTVLQSTLPKPRSGYVRYWFQVVAGSGQSLPLWCGPNVLIGQLTDSPAADTYMWRLDLPYYN